MSEQFPLRDVSTGVLLCVGYQYYVDIKVLRPDIFRCLHGTAPPYLADQLQPVAALESRRRLRSSASISARLDK